jgi:hypothetical protein
MQIMHDYNLNFINKTPELLLKIKNAKSSQAIEEAWYALQKHSPEAFSQDYTKFYETNNAAIAEQKMSELLLAIAINQNTSIKILGYIINLTPYYLPKIHFSVLKNPNFQNPQGLISQQCKEAVQKSLYGFFMNPQGLISPKDMEEMHKNLYAKMEEFKSKYLQRIDDQHYRRGDTNLIQDNMYYILYYVYKNLQPKEANTPLDGQDIDDITEYAIKECITKSPQQYGLFNTVFLNILNQPNIRQETIIRIITVAIMLPDNVFQPITNRCIAVMSTNPKAVFNITRLSKTSELQNTLDDMIYTILNDPSHTNTIQNIKSRCRIQQHNTQYDDDIARLLTIKVTNNPAKLNTVVARLKEIILETRINNMDMISNYIANLKKDYVLSVFLENRNNPHNRQPEDAHNITQIYNQLITNLNLEGINPEQHTELNKLVTDGFALFNTINIQPVQNETDKLFYSIVHIIHDIKFPVPRSYTAMLEAERKTEYIKRGIRPT